MSKPKKEKEIIAIEDMSPDDRMKYEIATELGLLDKVRESGWKSLSAKETGRIGGIMTKRKKQMRLEEPNKKL
jgi:small acid-soluble spore protein F (minor alpha/beta-type SASP)